MKISNKISVLITLILVLGGCATQSSQNSTNNFDQLKASKTRVSLGLTYLKNGNFSQAKFNLDKALEFAPRSADANFAMAYYYQNVGELELAEKAYQFAMDLEPKNANIANSYGAFLCQNGNYEKAKTYFLKAVNTSSYISTAETYENLALCSQSQGKERDAIQYLRSAVNHQPGRANSLFLLSQGLVETQQWQEARDILRRYEKISQISPQSLNMARKIELGTGNLVAAKGYADMLLRIFPTDPITKQMLTEARPADRTTNLTVIPPKNSAASAITNAQVIATNIQDELVTPVVVITQPETQSEQSANKETANNSGLQGNVNKAKEHSDSEMKTQQDNDVIAIEVDPEEQTSPDFHIVVKGDNLYRISLMYNIKMQRLMDWNELTENSKIFNGMKLSLVAPSDAE